MVTISPKNNSLSCGAASEGALRNETRPFATLKVQPSTKCVACTCVLKCAAARSCRAGVTLLSAITFFQHGIQGPRGICLTADGPSGLWPVDPGGNGEMRPAFCLADKAG